MGCFLSFSYVTLFKGRKWTDVSFEELVKKLVIESSFLMVVVIIDSACVVLYVCVCVPLLEYALCFSYWGFLRVSEMKKNAKRIKPIAVIEGAQTGNV